MVAIIKVAIKLRLDSRQSENRRMISPRRVRDVNQLVSFVQLGDRLGCNFDAATAAYALQSREENEELKINFREP